MAGQRENGSLQLQTMLEGPDTAACGPSHLRRPHFVPGKNIFLKKTESLAALGWFLSSGRRKGQRPGLHRGTGAREESYLLIQQVLLTWEGTRCPVHTACP